MSQPPPPRSNQPGKDGPEPDRPSNEPWAPAHLTARAEPPLADRVPGAVAHDVYASSAGATWPPTNPPDPAEFGGLGGLPPLPPPASRPTGWNAPAFGMLTIFLLALSALVYPQYRARATEHKVKPMVAALAQRDAGARCPRYITAIFTNVGSVSLDASGRISDHTDLTGPICDGLRRLYTPAGQAEMDCLVTDGRCSTSALQSVIALSVVAHESMHLRGILDEAAAECASIAEGGRGAELAGLSTEQGRMVAWLHYAALNANTPSEYAVSAESCPAVAELQRNPPGNHATRGLATTLAEETWVTLGDG